ncbi:MarR family transcriptional regulator [Sinomonas sp. ASV486]|uniref:GbsR/MarR family transcriptional regulator n=1 Tax=Sinomonas sp. ASV486 TaxID=3051170 RepID=UPI0027DC3FCD|nr:MarR family transcriptional regulator [Sinomonas sp. ASV486]MDQ4491902.1 MarR family transcriptional regulator [Sinomonas sp. ASV486]
MSADPAPAGAHDDGAAAGGAKPIAAPAAAAAGDPAGVVRPEAGMSRIPEAAEGSAAVMIAAGFPKMPARALMALVVSDDGALTAAELAEVLGASPAAVSGAVRYLQTVGFAHRVSQPGSRRDRYALPDDLWYVATLRQNPVYDRLGSLSSNLADELPAGSAARARAEDMAHFYRFIARRMPRLLDEWEQERAADRGRPD